MATFGNYPTIKGSIKQGGLIGKVDFGTGQNAQTLVWNIFIVLYDNVLWPFYQPVVNGTNGTITPLTKEVFDGISPSDFGKALPLLQKAVKPAIQFTTKGITYTTSASDIYYTDGSGSFKADAYEDVSTTMSVKDVLASLGTPVGTGKDGDTVDLKWYQKTWVKVTGISVVVGAVVIFVWKKYF